MSFHLLPIGLAGGESGVALHVLFFLDGFCCGSGKSKSTSAAFLFRWFKFTLKPPYSIAREKLRLAIWDTSFWTFWLKFGHKGP